MPIGINTLYHGEVVDSFEPPVYKVRFVVYGLLFWLLYSVWITWTAYNVSKAIELQAEGAAIEQKIQQTDTLSEQLAFITEELEKD